MEIKKFLNHSNLSDSEKTINNYLEKIGNAFLNKKATALVGTGFSLNAKKINKTGKNIPMWQDIGNLLMEELSIDKGNNSFVDPIRLSSQYVAYHNENELNNFLIKNIEDDNFIPDDVHNEFVSLDWNDIFTTNYDTLLERATKNIDKKYTVVTDDKSLPSSPKPRIIKLHGSFPDKTPFIMTNEQFRVYPTEHAGFVNTVQQSFIEDTIVLFGFSGTDPNFQKWTGWIRDNIGEENANNVYLISVDPVSKAESMLFDDENIKVIDLSSILNKDNKIESIKKTFLEIFEYWKNFYKSDEEFSTVRNFNDIDIWLSNLWRPYYDITNKIKASSFEKILSEFIEKWENERKNFKFPFILAKSHNNILFSKTKEVALDFNFLKSMRNDALSISFLYELNWRWEKCNVPLFEHMIDAFNTAIGYDEEKQEINVSSFEPDIKQKAYNLLISLYRASREDNNIELCDIYETIILNSKIELSTDLINMFTYEKCILAFYKKDYLQFIDCINNWCIEENDYLYSIKKAGLLSEIGKEKIGYELLLSVKNQLDCKIKNEKENLQLLFLESIVNNLILYINSATKYTNEEIELINIEKLRLRNSILSGYGCNISDILKSYSNAINIKENQKLKKLDFDTDIKTRNIVISENPIPYSSYMYLRIYEEIGFPLRLNFCVFMDSEKTHIAINNVLALNFDWAINLILKSYDENVVEKILDKDAINTIESEEINILITKLVDVFFQYIDLIGSEKEKYLRRVIECYPELLSRLCSKANHDSKLMLVRLLITIMNKDIMFNLPRIETFVRRVMKSLSVEEKIQVIPELINIKCPRIKPVDEYHTLNPWMYLEPLSKKDLSFEIKNINQLSIHHVIDNYNLSEAPYQKNWYLNTLINLNRWNVLDKHSKELFGEALWSSEKDENGLPIIKDFYKFVVLTLPAPKTVDKTNLYSKYLDEILVPIVSNSTGIHIRLSEDSSAWTRNIIYVDDDKVFNTDIFIKLITKLQNQWELDHKLLQNKRIDPFFDLKTEAINNFHNAASVLAKLINVFFDELKDEHSILFSYRDNLKQLISNYRDNGINCLEALALFSLLAPELEANLFDSLKNNLSSYNQNDVIDALNAINHLFDVSNSIFSKTKKIKIWKLLVESILWKSTGDLYNCLRACNGIIQYKDSLVSSEDIDSLIFGIKNLRSYIAETDSIDINEKTKIKSMCSSLAFSIKSYCEKRKIKINDEINEWENIAKDENEFVDVRNQWIIV